MQGFGFADFQFSPLICIHLFLYPKALPLGYLLDYLWRLSPRRCRWVDVMLPLRGVAASVSLLAVGHIYH
jgi:hypothetical protein